MKVDLTDIKALENREVEKKSSRGPRHIRLEAG